MVPSRSRKTAWRREVCSGTTHLQFYKPWFHGGSDHFRRDAFHAAMIGGAAAQEAGAAVRLFLHNGEARGDWSGAEWIGGAEDGDDWKPDGGGYVHGAGIVAEE